MQRTCPSYWPSIGHRLWLTQMGVSDVPCSKWVFIVSLLSVERTIHQEIKPPRLPAPILPLFQRATSNSDGNVLRDLTEGIGSLALRQDTVSHIVLFPSVPTDPAFTDIVFAGPGPPSAVISSPDLQVRRCSFEIPRGACLLTTTTHRHRE